MSKNTIKLILLTILCALPITTNAYTDTANYEGAYGPALEYAEVLRFFNEGEVLEPEKKVTMQELIKAGLIANDFIPDGQNTIQIEGVDDEYSAYVDRMRELGIIYFNPNDANFNGTIDVHMWRGLNALMKLEGIPVPKIFDTEAYRSAFPYASPNAFYSAVMFKAHQLGFIKSKVAPLERMTRIDLISVLYLLDQYQQKLDALSSNSTNTVRILVQQDPRVRHPLVQNNKFSILLDVWDRVTTDFLNNKDINQDELIYGAIEGLVDKLGDQFSVFQDPSTSAAFQNSLSNSLQGIGASLALDDDKNVVIVSPIKGSPAEAAGIKSGDIINTVDGKSVRNLNLSEVVKMIQGPSGTTVILEITRNGTIITYTIKRAQITVPSVEAEVTSDNIVIMKMNNFGSRTAFDFKDLLQQVKPTDTNGVIIDLRNNPGGFLNAAIDIAGNFLTQGKIVTRIRGPKINEAELSPGPGNYKDVPIIVLINKGSASAAEILAGALQPQTNVKVIGTTSYGKGTVQEITSYTDESALKLTIAEWLLPSGKSINKIGIRPDIFIDYTDADAKAGIDPQMSRALRELRK